MSKYLLLILLYCCSPLVSAQTLVESFMHDGVERDYRVYVPELYTGEQAVPLVLNMHGRGSDALQQEFYSGFNNVADTANCIVVYPNGIDNLWNAAFIDPPPNDVDFLNTLIDRISNTYLIDANRIYSTGMSMGGFMSYSLACELSDRIAAIASVTGSMGENAITNCNPKRPVPILQIHGTNDAVVPIEGQGGTRSIEEVITFWREKNGCTTDGVSTDFPDIDTGDETTISRVVYAVCNETAEVILYTIENGGHTWPGAFHIPSFGETNQDIHASAEIWQFFSRHGLNGLLSSTGNTNAALLPSKLITIQQNPFSEYLSIQLEVETPIQLMMYNSKGQQVLTQQTAAQHEVSLSTAHLSTGIYFLQATTNKGIQMIKVMKQ